MQTEILPLLAKPTQRPPTSSDNNPMWVQAQALEASFLAEMLGYAGVGTVRDGFGGGIGEEQFSSFLRDEEAKQMVAHGGIGLAEQLFHAMQAGAANA